MSVSSILGLVFLGTKAFTSPRDKAEERPTRTRYSELVIENGELKARVAELEEAIGAANVQARRDQELIDIWRERAIANVPAVVAGPPSLVERQSRAALQQAQAAQLAQQANAQMAQMAQQQYAVQSYPSGLLGLLGQGVQAQAQSLMDAEFWCNCVPARHDMLRPQRR
jgi:hypothetical protein